ncbi:hypothetical protein ABBQ38_003248 [Trebouxia sp. C0009 RCD-2024]
MDYPDVEEALLSTADLSEDFPIVQQGSCNSRHGSTLVQGTFNLINIFMGLGLLSMPYAMRLSGWLGLAAMAALTCLFCLSGKLIVHAFAKMPLHCAQSYPNLGQLALGKPGRYLVAGFALSEFFGGGCMMLIVMWRIVMDMLPDQGVAGISSFHAAVGGTSLLILPMLFIQSFQRLSWLSMVGFISTMVVTATALLLVAVDPLRTHMPTQPAPGHTMADWNIIQACGIFAMSVSGHSSLPVLRNSMAKPQEFDSVLNVSFSLMLGVYGTVAALGYYYFGSSAHTLLTTDLARNSPFTGHYFLLPGLTADKLVALCIMLNAYSTYPSLVLVMQDMIVSILPGGQQGSAWRQPHQKVALAMRLLIFAAGGLTAYAAFAVLGNVMSLVGGMCSMCCSLLLPSLFYLILHKHELSLIRKIGVILLLLCGVALLLLIVVQNLQDLISPYAPIPGNSISAVHLGHRIAMPSAL